MHSDGRSQAVANRPEADAHDRPLPTLCGHSDRSPSHVGIGATGLRPDLAGISIEIHRQGSRRITTNLSVGIVAGLNRGLA